MSEHTPSRAREQLPAQVSLAAAPVAAEEAVEDPREQWVLDALSDRLRMAGA